jgi:hypothetical protein
MGCNDKKRRCEMKERERRMDMKGEGNSRLGLVSGLFKEEDKR